MPLILRSSQSTDLRNCSVNTHSISSTKRLHKVANRFALNGSIWIGSLLYFCATSIAKNATFVTLKQKKKTVWVCMKHGNSFIFLKPYKYTTVAIEIIAIKIAITRFIIDSIYISLISLSFELLWQEPIFFINY